MYRKTVLTNGIRILSERIDHVRSVTIGVWVRCGSRHEDEGLSGTAHFIEHMLFKGTKRRSAFDIAAAIDSVGGVMNAFTGKEMTAFYIKIPDYHLALAIDLLADILRNSTFAAPDILREKSVIIQEIHMLEDSPEDYIHDFFEAAFWRGHPLARPVLGTQERIESLRRDALLRFFRGWYRGEHVVITAAGRLEHEALRGLVASAFDSLESGENKKEEISRPAPRQQTTVLEKDLEQVHLVVGTTAPATPDPDRYPAFVLNAVLGGSMSSRLFQEVREQRGLVYEIHSYLVPYMDSGMLGVYAGTGGEHVDEVLCLVFSAFDRLCQDLLTDRELSSAKELLKGNFLLSMESTDSRMIKLAREEICFGRVLPAEEITARMDAVTAQDVRELACRMFHPGTISLAAIGRVAAESLDLDRFRPS